jgi:hypothetical protein
VQAERRIERGTTTWNMDKPVRILDHHAEIGGQV